MIKIICLFVYLQATVLFSEDMSGILSNNNYQSIKIKKKAKKNKNSDGCYIYIEITGNSEWEEKKEKLNIIINEKKRKCRKITIYKSIKNVNTGSNWKLSGKYSKNSQSKDYNLNMGVIIKGHSDIDIETITVIKNSKIGSGFSQQEANTGILIQSDDIDIDNRKLKTSTIIKNSHVGKENSIIQSAINIGVDFIADDN